MTATSRGLAVVATVERLLALEGLELHHARSDPNYLVVIGPDAWKALADHATTLGLTTGPAPDVRDRVLGYGLILDPFLGGQVRLVLVVGEGQAVPNDGG